MKLSKKAKAELKNLTAEFFGVQASLHDAEFVRAQTLSSILSTLKDDAAAFFDYCTSKDGLGMTPSDARRARAQAETARNTLFGADLWRAIGWNNVSTLQFEEKITHVRAAVRKCRKVYAEKERALTDVEVRTIFCQTIPAFKKATEKRAVDSLKVRSMADGPKNTGVAKTQLRKAERAVSKAQAEAESANGRVKELEEVIVYVCSQMGAAHAVLKHQFPGVIEKLSSRIKSRASRVG